jgi:hypothetical protein
LVHDVIAEISTSPWPTSIPVWLVGTRLIHFAGFTVAAVDEALTHQLGEFTLERRQIETVMRAPRAGPRPV